MHKKIAEERLDKQRSDFFTVMELVLLAGAQVTLDIAYIAFCNGNNF